MILELEDVKKKISNFDSMKNFPISDLVDCARWFGDYLAQGRRQEALSTSQIRNVFGEVKKMQMGRFDRRKFKLLEPRLAYVAGKNRGKTIDLKEVLVECITRTNDQDDFGVFADFFEAILAYHREAESKKSKTKEE